MHLLSTAIEREVPTQFLRVASGPRHRGWLFIVFSERERDTPQFLPEVFAAEGPSSGSINDQVITQDIKAMCAGPLHSHLVREQPKIVPELYEQLAKFSKFEIQHFHKLEQQRKVSKPDEAPRPHHNENWCSYPKPVHNIDSDGCGP
jgi:hypothetical protein